MARWRRGEQEIPQAGSAASPAAVAGAAAAAAAEVEQALVVPSDPTAAAFFDVDNTMMMGASIYYFARGLAARKFFTTARPRRLRLAAGRVPARGSEEHGQMVEARKSALAFVAGQKVEEIVGLGEEIYDELMADRIWSGTRALAQHAPRRRPAGLAGDRRAGRAGLADRPPPRADRRARHGGRVEDGVYTGRLVGEPLHGPAKAEAVRALARARASTWTRCSAYRDSVNDLPMLTTVGHPIAVNPDARSRQGRKGERLARSATTGPVARPRASASRPRSESARWPAGWPRASRGAPPARRSRRCPRTSARRRRSPSPAVRRRERG